MKFTPIMYIHHTTHKILYMKDFTKYIGLHIIELTNYAWHHITQHIILSKCSPPSQSDDTHHRPKLPHTAVRLWPVVDQYQMNFIRSPLD